MNRQDAYNAKDAKKDILATESHGSTRTGQRLGRSKEALSALHKAVEADPGDGYAHRNLGALLAGGGELTEALPHFREAFHQLPDDPQSIFGLAQCLESLGDADMVGEADDLYRRFLERFPASPMAETVRRARTRIAQRNMRAAGPGGFRPDVMMYIAGALETLEKISATNRQEVALEIAILGQQGLDINDSTQKYTLRTLPGKFSGLHLLAIMYTAFKQIDPTLDSGVDFGREYQAALKMAKGQN